MATFEDVGGMIAFAPNSETFVARTGQHCWELAEWEVNSKRRTSTLRGDAQVLRYDSDGVLAIVPHGGSIEAWNESTGVRLGTSNFMLNQNDSVAAIEITPDRSMLIVLSISGMLHLVPLQGDDDPAKIQTNHRFVNCAALSHDGHTLAIGGFLNSGIGVSLFDLSLGTLRRTVQMRRDPTCLSFSSNDCLLAAGYGGLRYTFLTGLLQTVGSPDSCYGRVLLYDVTTGRTVATLGDQKHWVSSVGFSPDGRMLAAGGSGGPASEPHLVMVWDTQTKEKIVTLSGHGGDIETVRFSPDGVLLATQSENWTGGKWQYTTTLWKVPDQPPRVDE